jgi:transcriptional regulator with XRE-family HTH domain
MSSKQSKNLYAAFGHVTKQRRLQLGLTQERIAEQVGVRPNYVGYLERGLRKPSDEICCRLADVLGLDRKELFLLANPQLEDYLAPREQPGKSAWEIFIEDHELHRRQHISSDEVAVLAAVNRLGSIQHPRDYLFILNVVRQSLSRG